jgi:hypothetical protein
MRRNIKSELNNCMPIAKDVKLGDLQQELIDAANADTTQLLSAHNSLVEKFNALLVKLDADSVLDEDDYEETLEASPATEVSQLVASHNALVSKFNDLLTKLDDDTNLDDDDYLSELEAGPVDEEIVISPPIQSLNDRWGSGTFGGPEEEIQ